MNFGFSVTYDENVMEEPHMHDAKDERTRQEFKRFIDKLESM